MRSIGSIFRTTIPTITNKSTLSTAKELTALAEKFRTVLKKIKNTTDDRGHKASAMYRNTKTALNAIKNGVEKAILSKHSMDLRH